MNINDSKSLSIHDHNSFMISVNQEDGGFGREIGEIEEMLEQMRREQEYCRGVENRIEMHKKGYREFRSSVEKYLQEQEDILTKQTQAPSKTTQKTMKIMSQVRHYLSTHPL